MSETKTRPTSEDVASFVDALDHDEKRADSRALIGLMQRASGEPPMLWGADIIGFGAYNYQYASGHRGSTALVGFSPRKREFSIYLMGAYLPEAEAERKTLLSQLGRHRMGKACLYVRRLADIDVGVLEKLVRLSVQAIRSQYTA